MDNCEYVLLRLIAYDVIAGEDRKVSQRFPAERSTKAINNAVIVTFCPLPVKQ
jgi:hypothetical protein